MSVNHLIPAITRALTAPGVDLGQISAKSVRKSMLAADSSLEADWVKDNKEAIDTLIGDIFNTVTAANNANSSSQKPAAKRKRTPTPEGPLPPSQIPISTRDAKPPAAVNGGVTKREKIELTDAELARQLSAELNPTATRATRGSGSAKPTKSAKGSAKKKKSKANIEDSDEEGNDDDDARPKKKRAKTKEGGGGGAKGGLSAEYMLSDTLAELTGMHSLSRPQVVKQLWVYIKAKDLQNPSNKREILCDDKFRAVFNCDKIDMFKMNKELGAHLFKPGEVA